MNSMQKKKLLMSLLMLLTAFGLLALETQRVEKSFTRAAGVSIRTVNGDVELKPSSDEQIHVLVIHAYPQESYKVVSELKENELNLSETFSRGSFAGHSSWVVSIPDDLSVKVTSASGRCRVSDLNVRLQIRNASGNVELNRVNGRIEVKTASGDLEGAKINGTLSFNGASGDVKLTHVEGEVTIRGASSDFWGANLKGEVGISLASGDLVIRDSALALKARTSSGDLSIRDVVLTGDSELGTASGSVLLRLAAAITADLVLKSASGRVTLQLNGIPSDIELICSVNKDRGQIMAPFSFESAHLVERNGQQYLEKKLRLGKAMHRVLLVSSSGDLVVEK